MRQFEETELTKLIKDALEDAQGHLLCRGLHNDPMIEKYEALLQKINTEALDVSFTSRD